MAFNPAHVAITACCAGVMRMLSPLIKGIMIGRARFSISCLIQPLLQRGVQTHGIFQSRMSPDLLTRWNWSTLGLRIPRTDAYLVVRVFGKNRWHQRGNTCSFVSGPAVPQNMQLVIVGGLICFSLSASLIITDKIGRQIGRTRPLRGRASWCIYHTSDLLPTRLGVTAAENRLNNGRGEPSRPSRSSATATTTLERVGRGWGPLFDVVFEERVREAEDLTGGAEEGWPRQEPRRVFRRRHGDDQSARAHLEIHRQGTL